MNKGWHSRGYLPHFDSPETTQFVTFRLFDSLPAEALEKLARWHGPIGDADRDAFLDAGSGNCWLRRPEIVHVLIEPIEGHTLGAIVSSWKRLSARMANRVLGRSGPFWQEDYWDTYIRNERHFESTISYIENNPIKAGLAAEPDEWLWGHVRLTSA